MACCASDKNDLRELRRGRFAPRVPDPASADVRLATSERYTFLPIVTTARTATTRVEGIATTGQDRAWERCRASWFRSQVRVGQCQTYFRKRMQQTIEVIEFSFHGLTFEVRYPGACGLSFHSGVVVLTTDVFFRPRGFKCLSAPATLTMGFFLVGDKSLSSLTSVKFVFRGTGAGEG